ALEEQKRRRSQRVDSARHLDRFADLTLGISEDEEEVAMDLPAAPGSVAKYASMLGQAVDPTMIENHVVAPLTIDQDDQGHLVEEQSTQVESNSLTSAKKKKKKKNRGKRQNKWADRCMYAELLEMAVPRDDWDAADGLPSDLETGWVAVGPVPVGKRCLAVTQQAGVPGIANTTLRSRLLGKVLLHRFPSTLPPLTVLDCILDGRWRENGILHVLDVIKWKGQDVADCESAFRFWWRDTRLTELGPTPPPLAHPHLPTDADTQQDDVHSYRFPYPTTLVPVPYYTDTTLPTLLTNVVPAARAPRVVPVSIPILTSSLSSTQTVLQPSSQKQSHPYQFGFASLALDGSGGMDIDGTFEFGSSAQIQTQSVEARVDSDGLLLYVQAAAYEPGTSPLSSWIPLGEEGGLDLFESLVRRRMVRSREVDMDMDG
ncbi:hypothetical protein H0H81_003061, partial [Sphagnurus paluster]